MIDSMADTGSRIFAVVVPGRSCPACRENGETFFKKTERGRYRAVYFQDRDRDLYLVK